MDEAKPCDWDDISFAEVQFVALRAKGVDRTGRAVQVAYDRGSVLVTENVDSAAPTTRVLRLREIRSLLEALRKQARLALRAKDVDSAALRAMIGALARLVHSPGRIPFGATSFGAIQQDENGIVGHVEVEPGWTATIRARNGELSLEMHRHGATGQFARRLTLEQLRALIQALRARSNPTMSPDDLWMKILEDATRREAAIRDGIQAARGTRPASAPQAPR